MNQWRKKFGDEWHYMNESDPFPPDDWELLSTVGGLTVKKAPHPGTNGDLVFFTGKTDYWEIEPSLHGYSAVKLTNERMRFCADGSLSFPINPLECYPFHTPEMAELFIKYAMQIERRHAH